MMFISLGFLSLFFMIFTIATAIIIYFFIRKNKSNVIVYKKNILVYIGLLVFSGIIYMLYEKITNILYLERWPSMFLGIVIIFYILFLNITGITYSIMKLEKINLTLLTYTLFVVSSILIYNLIKFIGNIAILSESSSIIPIGLFILIENILSWIIVKVIVKIKNRVRPNCA